MDVFENAALFVNITSSKDCFINTRQFITEDEVAEHIFILLFELVCSVCNIHLLCVQVSLSALTSQTADGTDPADGDLFTERF